jgi:uncharacterized protein YndB with AHSA1/START domain
MDFHLGVFVPAPIEEVFDFLDDPTNMLGLGGHAAEHAAGLEVVETKPDGRRTFDLRMRAGQREWVQTIRQTVRERPHRLVTEGWTWVADRADPYLLVTNDRRLTVRDGATRVDASVTYELRKRSLQLRALNWLQRGQIRIELEHQLHYLAEHFVSNDIPQR